jgi:hypothetical protein
MTMHMNGRDRGQTTGYRVLIAIPTAIVVAAAALVAYGLSAGPSAYTAAAAGTTAPSYGGIYALAGLSVLALAFVVALATWHAIDRARRGGVDA